MFSSLICFWKCCLVLKSPLLQDETVLDIGGLTAQQGIELMQACPMPLELGSQVASSVRPNINGTGGSKDTGNTDLGKAAKKRKVVPAVS